MVLKCCISVSNVINQGVYGQDLIRSQGSSQLFTFAVFRMTVVHQVCDITYAILQILVSIMLCALLQQEKLLCILQMVTTPSWGGGLAKQCGVGSSFVVGHCIPKIWTGGAVLKL